MTRIIGFDVSSQNIGWGVFDYEKNNKSSIKLIDSGVIKPSKKGSTLGKLKDAQNKVLAVLDKFKPDEAAIEDIIKFMKNKSTANTVIALASFNRMVCLSCWDKIGKEPSLLAVMTIRSAIKLNKSLPKKDEIPKVIEAHLGIKFPWIMHNNKISSSSYDMSDGIAVALAKIFKS